MKTIEVRFNVEDNGSFCQKVEYKDDAALAIDAYILLFNQAYGDIKGLKIESYTIVPKVQDLKEGTKVVNKYGTEFEVVGKQGRTYVELKRLSDGRVWSYDNETLKVERVEVVK